MDPTNEDAVIANTLACDCPRNLQQVGFDCSWCQFRQLQKVLLRIGETVWVCRQSSLLTDQIATSLMICEEPGFNLANCNSKHQINGHFGSAKPIIP